MDILKGCAGNIEIRTLKTKIPILGLFVPDLGMKAKRVYEKCMGLFYLQPKTGMD